MRLLRNLQRPPLKMTRLVLLLPRSLQMHQLLNRFGPRAVLLATFAIAAVRWKNSNT